ncbi:MAG: tetratricopeptide repeat protein [Cytophaga sp.]|uniref:tetratricopeptide repeat protein n=1 Tax=Cytophaga sp. TaxID=29535 RepID=UPI003F7FE4A8
MKELSDVILDRIDAICEEADLLFEEGKSEEAIAKYQEALTLLPEPIEEYEPSAWLISSIGDVYFFDEEYEKAVAQFEHAMSCIDSEDNPYLLLRAGQCYFELNQMQEAEDVLHEAYLIEGEEIFEEEEPKYWEFLKSKITIVD